MAVIRSRAVLHVGLLGVLVGFGSAALVSALLPTRPATRLSQPANSPEENAQAAANKSAAMLEPTDDESVSDLPDPALTAAIAPYMPPADLLLPIPADDAMPSQETVRVNSRAVESPRWSADQLRASLLQVPEIWLQPPNVLKVLGTGRSGSGLHPLLSILDARPDLHGLPAKRAKEAQLPRSEGDAVRDASVVLRKELSGLLGQVNRNRKIAIRPEVLAARPQIVTRLLHQMLQTQPVQLRRMLIDQLDKMPNATASHVLAHRTVYEPLPDLRQAAVKALANHPAAEYLPTLLEMFDSPWPPASDHAADAIIALAPAGAVPELVRRLDSPDQSAREGRGVRQIHELVRVNHARNCLLCHGQSVEKTDGVRVAVPNPTRSLPSPFSLDTYEGGGKGGSRNVGPDPTYVRPDITYIQQEFSWSLPVADHGPWPTNQRYDFLIRTRSAGPNDPPPPGPGSPQKQAIVRALRALTGQDFGDRGSDWRAGLALAVKDR